MAKPQLKVSLALLVVAPDPNMEMCDQGIWVNLA